MDTYSLPLIFSAISSIAAAGGLMYNGYSQIKNSKNKYYKMLNDLQEEYNNSIIGFGK